MTGLLLPLGGMAFSALLTNWVLLAKFILLLVIATIILGLQAFARFNPIVTVVLVALAALFAWRVYRTPIPYGWV